MSKDIAQTVGGKRFAWLLALLAVFVVIAGSQMLPAAASAAGSDGTLAAPEDQQGDVTAQLPSALPDVLLPGLYHVGPTGDLEVAFNSEDGVNDYWEAAPRDVENNLIGWEHTVCLVTDDGIYTAVTNPTIEADLLPGGDGGIAPVNPEDDFYNWRIQELIGDSDIVGAVKQAIDFSAAGADTLPPPPIVTVTYVNGAGLGGVGLPCLRWWSSGPGEQNITVITPNGTVAADWSDGDGTIIGVEDPPNEPPTNEPDVCSEVLEEVVEQITLEADSCDEGLSPSDPLVKEWNVLDRTEIKRAGPRLTAVGSDIQGTTVVVPAIFNPATSRFRALSNTGFIEEVYGEHTTTGGATLNPIVIGAEVTFTAAGTCGYTIVDGSLLSGTFGTTLEGTPAGSDPTPFIIYPGDSVTVTSIGVGIYFEIGTEDCVVIDDMTHTVTISVDYPANIGSQQPPLPDDEVITVKWVSQISQKKVLLAWAGQRIVLEHDWRIPPGGLDQPDWAVDGDDADDDNEDEAEEIAIGNVLRCPWTFAGIPVVFVSKFLKQSGPGTFLSNNELGPLTAIGDLLFDLISPDEINNITFATSCVSRAVYESNLPGQIDITLQVTDVCFDIDVDGGNNNLPVNGDQVDIDQLGGIPAAFDCFLEPIDPLNQSKVDFVVYYMKFEDVRLSLVTSVSKPTHNASAAAWADYAPGNPWNASTDVATAEWNVSRDLLVRGRVRGWFLNENPSGRARDDSDPLNVRPIDRWIMPDDWAILAGGPADPADGTDARGTAEEFRPYYDLMIAPNNTAGLALATPSGGVGATLVASVVAPATGANSATSFAVSSVANIQAGSLISVPAVGTSQGPGVCETPGVSSVASVVGNVVTLSFVTSGPDVGAGGLCATPAVGTGIFIVTAPFEGPLSLIDLPGLGLFSSAAPSSSAPGFTRDTTFPDGDVDMWDAPMPSAPVSVKIRGAGFIKQVLKRDVYYLGNPNVAAQVFPNPYYITNIPAEPWISAISAGGGYLWDSWALDGPGGAGKGPYHFWQFARIGTNIIGVGDALTAAEVDILNDIRAYYGDPTISRDGVVFSDNHGEFMVTANGDFKLDYSECATNAIAGGKHCHPGDKVGSSTITATVDYPEFRGKHPPVASNAVTVDWTWGGYKDVTIEAGETPQFAYIVFHALDRDGFCYFNEAVGTRSLHPVLTELDDNATIGTETTDPVESVDFLIDSGQGIIVGQSGGSLNVDGNRQFATGVPTFSTARNTTLKEFDFSPSASAEQTDECQAWVKVSNSLLGVVNFLVVAHDDEGDIGFDRVVDLQGTATYTLNFRWSLITWNGADNIPVTDALRGTGANDAGNDIFDQVTAVYGWEQASQDWLGFFPSGVDVPGANDLTNLKQGSAYWIAIKAPGPVTWTYATNVD